ncbi:MAG: twin-arginine translocation signal domain-containing protein [Planctomycetes bacterium]|nr:twin-arginine translocation signal domain-containing protein [Planctomycetota bacterium]MCB9885472.1 twin-arginine translocation signal domain-containing protein [Planctomycetota bacterium]
MTEPDSSVPGIDRRNLLRGLGAAGAAALVAGAAPLSARSAVRGPSAAYPILPGFEAPEDDDEISPPLPGVDPNPFAFPRARRVLSEAEAQFARDMLLQSSMCPRSPTATEGPYYVANPLVRQNIVEDRVGLPTTIFFQVVREADCSPIVNAAVDLWHADQAGVYSGYANQGTQGRVFLRGRQYTNALGIVQFDTIFPGWYPSRTAHLHLKVYPTANTVVTSQAYFDQLLGFSGSLSDAVYRFLPPYSSRGAAQTVNSTDNLFTPDTVMGAMLNPNGSPTLWAGLRFAVA